MKIVCISDTHGKHKELKLPEGDMIIHAGDISGMGRLHEITNFLAWFVELPYQYKVFIGGNHDYLLEDQPSVFKALIPDNLIYLENSEVEIEGLKLWGSPITPRFFDWAFNCDRGEKIKQYWDQIPIDTDILITHGPPLGQGDKTQRGEMVGCEDLLIKIQEVQPKYHIFGHIHEGYGITNFKNTTFINASVLDFNYKLVNPALTFTA